MSQVVTKNYIESLVSDNKKWKHHCPRCGGVFDRLLALSRYADVSICDCCGSDEALGSFIGDEIGLTEWVIYKESN